MARKTTAAGQHRSGAAALRSAARRFRFVVRLLRASLFVVPLVLLAGGAWAYFFVEPLYASPIIIATFLWLLAVPALAAGLSATPKDVEVGAKLNLVGEPKLYHLMASIAADMDVRPPSEIRLIPEPVLSIRLRPSRPVLLIGAPLFWHLDAGEFERVMAREMSLLRCVRGDVLRGTWEYVDRVDLSLLRSRTNVLNRWVLGPATGWLAASADRLHRAARAHADLEVPTRLMPRRGDDASMEEAARAWDTLRERWVQPALSRRTSVGNLLAASQQVMDAYVRGSHDLERSNTEPAYALLTDHHRVDADFSRWLWSQWGCNGVPVSWDDYPRRIALAEWRETTYNGARTYLGQTHALVRPTLDELIAAMAGRIPPVDLVAERKLLDAVVRSALLEAPEVTLSWDWLAGAVFRKADGHVVDVDALVDDVVSGGDLNRLRWWLNGVGVDVTQRLHQAGLRPSAVAAETSDDEPTTPVVVELDSVRSA